MRVITVACITGLVCALGTGAWLLSRERGPDPLAVDPNMPVLALPEMDLVDQDGHAFTRREFDGRVTIVSFGFSNCPLACPAMMTQMRRLYRNLEGENVRLVSFSLDGVNDTPEQLKHWAGTYNAAAPRWRLVTGPDGVTRDILGKHLKMHVRVDDGERVGTRSGGTMGNIEHTMNLLLIGPEGTMIGMYDSQSKDAMAALEARARAAGRRLR